MEFWKKNKWKIIAPVLIVLVLAVAFVFGDKNIPEQKDPTEQPGISAPAQPTQDDEMPEEPDDNICHLRFLQPLCQTWILVPHRLHSQGSA